MWFAVAVIGLLVACIELIAHWERKRDREELRKFEEWWNRHNDEA